MQRFGDQPAVWAVILHTLGDDVDWDAIDDVLDALLTFIVASKLQVVGICIGA
ncbi:hypothetical protein D3C84_1061770 [compost metagenome]